MTRINKWGIFFCLCCICFFLGTKLVGKTEASFSSQVFLGKISMTSALVFPATIIDLKERAFTIANSIDQYFKTMKQPSNKLGFSEVEDRLDRAIRIKQYINSFFVINNELAGYYQRVHNDSDLKYVVDGYRNVNDLINEKRITERSQQIDEMIEFYIEKLKLLDQEEKNKNSQEKVRAEHDEKYEKDISNLR